MGGPFSIPSRPIPGPSAGRQEKPDKNIPKTGKPPQSVQDDRRLQEACRQMESLFLSHLLKEMRATVQKSGFISGGQAEEIFTSLLDVEISKKMAARGGIGLSALLMQQLGAKGSRSGEDDIP